MAEIEGRNYVDGNVITRFLMDFCVRINICQNARELYFPLEVYSDNKLLLTFNFYTLEDAFCFMQDVIKESHTKEQIVEEYQKMFGEKKFVLPGGLKIEDEDTISLDQNEVDQAIIDYFGKNKCYRVSVKEKLTICDNQPDIAFYLIEHLEYNGVKKNISTRLTEGDLEHALGAYVAFYGYELIDFKYVGGIHRFYYYDDQPHYEGVRLSVKKKKKDQVLVKK